MGRHTLYFSDETLAQIELDKEGEEGLSPRVSKLCLMAVEMLREATPELTANEWSALAEVQNGARMAPSASVRDTLQSFVFSVMESAPELNEKWSVNCAALGQKLRGMSVAQQLAVIEICRRFWVKSHRVEGVSSYREIFEVHGARFAD